MKIEKESNKKAFEVRFLPRGGDTILEFIFAESYDKAKEQAGKMFASREITEIVEVK